MDNILKYGAMCCLAFITFVAADYYLDKQEAKASMRQASAMAEHCRIMAAVGKKC